MRNFVSAGDVIKLTAPDVADGVAAGSGLLNGSIFGVAVVDIAPGEDGPAQVVGVFRLPKVSAQAWTKGVKLYWDDSVKLVTSTASSNKAIGAAAETADNPSATGLVRLTGAAVN